MLPSCRQVAEQLSEEFDQPISGLRRFKLTIHLMMCKHCRRYAQQIELSAKSINLLSPKPVPDEALKQRVIAHYREFFRRKDDS